MSKFSKLVGMAKESFNDQMASDRAEGAADEIDERAASVQKRGQDMLGTNGVFNSVEDVLIVGVQRGEPLEEHTDKVNAALTSLSKKLMDSEFVVTGEGRAAQWPQDRNRLLVLTDQRLLLLKRGKVFTTDDIVYEVPVQEIEGFSHKRGMKGDKLTVQFKDESSIEIGMEDTPVEGFQYRFLRIIGR
jgi:hypothetical protein